MGAFESDRRHGPGTLHRADGSVFRGTYADNRRDGVGVLVHADGESAVRQLWQEGGLVRATPIEADPDCRLTLGGREWMFEGERCLDTHAHGRGWAVSLDGTHHVRDGRFVLGHLVAGEVRRLGSR